MKCFVFAGEHSGEIYGAELVKILNDKISHITFHGIGGNNMSRQGVNLIRHIDNLAIMGVSQVISKFFLLIRTFYASKRALRREKPDMVILIDYSGFNLRIAKSAKKMGLKVVYYIPPKVWAWGEKRIEKIKKYVDKVFIIFPFEKTLYDKHQIPCVYVGNPLIEQINKQSNIEVKFSNKNIIAVMPGSRKEEVKLMLPTMLKVAIHFPAFVFVIIKSNNLDDSLYEHLIKQAQQKSKNIFSVRNLEHAILSVSIAAIVKSGTSTLKVALKKIPQIVCYKTTALNYFLIRLVVKVQYASLPNLILNKEVAPELIQNKMTEENIKNKLQNILYNKNNCKVTFKSDYERIIQQLDPKKLASQNVALEIINFVGHTK